MGGIAVLAERLGAALEAAGLRLVTAESCTGGWIAEAVTAVPGSSAWFDRGAVAYSNAAKREMLDVPASLIETHGAVSEEVVAAMARGRARRGAPAGPPSRSAASRDPGGAERGEAGRDGMPRGGNCPGPAPYPDPAPRRRPRGDPAPGRLRGHDRSDRGSRIETSGRPGRRRGVRSSRGRTATGPRFAIPFRRGSLGELRAAVG